MSVPIINKVAFCLVRTMLLPNLFKTLHYNTIHYICHVHSCSRFRSILNRWTPLCTTHPKTMCYYFYNLRFRRGVLHLCFLSTYHHSLIQSSCPCSYTETLYRWLNCMCPHWHNISQYIDLNIITQYITYVMYILVPVLDQCIVKYCANGGTCSLTNDIMSQCSCRGNWTGSNCVAQSYQNNCDVFCRSLFVLLYFFFFLTIVLSILPFTVYRQPLCIYKLF
jgi:hypothetical protein